MKIPFFIEYRFGRNRKLTESVSNCGVGQTMGDRTDNRLLDKTVKLNLRLLNDKIFYSN